MSEQRITYTIENGIADVKMVRTDKMNALDDAMISALIDTAAELENHPEVRVVVLSGDGRAFCAGLDTSNFKRTAEGNGGSATVKHGGGLADRTHGIANRAQQIVWGWRNLHAPVIAAVHGIAFGGGFQLTLGADIRFVHPETKLSIMEAKWGLIPDMGGTPVMRAIASEDILRELSYTARIFSGEQAKEYGFATHVSESPYDDAMALAREIAERSPSSVKRSKKMFNALFDATDAEALLTESVLQDEIIGKPNQVEAVKAGMEKRVGNFSDTSD
jgi:enoyl-CoA hydratase/carnithine racemase